MSATAPSTSAVLSRLAAPAALSRAHVTALDGVRGLAIFIVLVHHLTSSCWPRTHPSVHGLHDFLFLGWSGVDLFFVLSGFLITGILLDTKNAVNYFKVFYARRILRIFPLYYLVLTTLVIAAHLPVHRHLVPMFPPTYRQPFYFVYLNNWLPLHPNEPNIIGHFWTLAIEEQFYLIWPLCVWLLPRKRILPTALAGSFIGLALRAGFFFWYTGLQHAAPPNLLENLFVRGLDTLLAGAALACLIREPETLAKYRRLVYGLGLISCAVLCYLMVLHRPGTLFNIIGFNFLAFAFSALVLFAFENGGKRTFFARLLKAPPLTSLGKYSYGIYVYHVPIMIYAAALIGAKIGLTTRTIPSILFSLGVMVASYLVAVLSFRFFEEPFLSLKSRFIAKYPAEV